MPQTLVFVEGSFGELAMDMAKHLEVEADVKPLVDQNANDEVLKKLVAASAKIHQGPEASFQPVYNLLIYLVVESPNAKLFLPKICDNLCTIPITSSPVNGTNLSLFALQSIFNLLPPESNLRYHALVAILRFHKDHGQFEAIKPFLPNVSNWMDVWKTSEAEQRKMYLKIAEVAGSAEDEGICYQYLLKALETFVDADLSSEEAQSLSLRALRMALLSSTKFDFNDLRNLATIQALSESHPVWTQLLDIFSEQDLDDYVDFLDEHDNFLENESLDGDKLHRKMRLLTFATLAAHAQSNTREIEYKTIAKALNIPSEEVEMWTIDVIRAGLVEGKLSQQRKVFLVHRATYRVFSDKQWRELDTRIQNMRQRLVAIVEVIDKGEKEVVQQRKREEVEAAKKLAQAQKKGADKDAD